MNVARRLFLIVMLILPLASQASPAEAERIRKTWDLEMERWILETRAATTPEARAAALERQPDSVKAARDMWRQIGPALDKEWTLEHVAWFLRVAPGLFSTRDDGARVQVYSDEVSAVIQAIETHHTRSRGLAPVCMALAATADLRTLRLLENILASHPETKVQGVAALAAAIILRSLGDDPELMRKRLNYLRKAIIDSSDVDLGGGTTVANLAEDELYVIRFLTKGRVAPDLEGIDSAGRPIKLSDHAGRIVVLLFWSSTMDEAERTIEMMAGAHRRFRDRPVVLLGVNHDPLARLRELEADGSVPWRNFSDTSNQLAQAFRVGSWPLVYVLDGDRRIQYSGNPGSFADLTVEALLSETDTGGSE